MKVIKHVFVSVLILFFVVSGFGWGVAAQEQDQKVVDQQQRMMELWKKYNSPGEKHKHLEYFVGDWESIQEIFPGGGAEPVIYHQAIHVESLFEGRFTRAHIKIKEKVMGMHLEGIVITGYDNYKQEVVSVTFGNMGTNLMFMSGDLDQAGKTRIDHGISTNVFAGKENKVKAVTTIIDDNRYIYEHYRVNDDGSETKSMKITYTRKK